jgi:hypothetical protein
VLIPAMAEAARSVPGSQAVPGVLGFLVVAGMGVVLFFLLRSMNKQLRKVSPQRPGMPGRDASPTRRTVATDAGENAGARPGGGASRGAGAGSSDPAAG